MAASSGAAPSIYSGTAIILQFILAATAAFAIAAITASFYPKEGRDVLPPEAHLYLKFITSGILAIMTGAVFYRLLNKIRLAIFVVATCGSFEQTMHFVGPFITEKQRLQFWHDFSSMKSEDDARKINRRLVDIADSAKSPIPWKDTLIL